MLLTAWDASKGNLVFAVRQKQEVVYIFDKCFSGNILLDIKTTRHMDLTYLRYYLLDSLFIWEGLLGWERAGRPRQNVVLQMYEYSIFYSRHHVILWTRFSISIDVIFSYM